MRRIQVLALVLSALVIIAGCGGAKYAQEKTVLDGLAKAMETVVAAVNSSDSPAGVSQALGSFSGTVEKFLPQMKSLTADHPDWETNPPEELKDTFAKFESAKKGFQGVMPKITNMAKENLDNAELQSAVNKFISVVGEM